MTPKQEEVAEKLIHYLQNTKKHESIHVSISRFCSREEINEVKFSEQLIPFLEDDYQLISKQGHTQYYKLTEAGVDFISFEKLREEQELEKERNETSHLLTKERLKEIEESRVISVRAEERAEKAEKRAVIAEIRANISIFVAIIAAIPLIIMFIKWLLSLINK